MAFEIQHTRGSRTLTIEGLYPPHECLCVDSLHLTSNSAIDNLALKVYEIAGLNLILDSDSEAKREMAIVELTPIQLEKLKQLCIETQKCSPDLHLLILNAKDGRWNCYGNPVKRAFFRMSNEDVEKIKQEISGIIVNEKHLSALCTGYFEDLDIEGNDLADLAMKAFFDGLISKEVLARALLYVSLSDEKNIELIHLKTRNGHVNEEGVFQFKRRMGWGPSSTIIDRKYGSACISDTAAMKFIEDLRPEEDLVFVVPNSFRTFFHPSFRQRLTKLAYPNDISVESNPVFYFSKTDDFCGPRRDAFIPYHRIIAPEGVHGRKISPIEIYDHDSGHQVFDSASKLRAFWTTVGLRCLFDEQKVCADFALDRTFYTRDPKNKEEILDNIKRGIDQKEAPLTTETIATLSEVALNVLKTYEPPLT